MFRFYLIIFLSVLTVFINISCNKNPTNDQKAIDRSKRIALLRDSSEEVDNILANLKDLSRQCQLETINNNDSKKPLFKKLMKRSEEFNFRSYEVTKDLLIGIKQKTYDISSKLEDYHNTPKPDYKSKSESSKTERAIGNLVNEYDKAYKRGNFKIFCQAVNNTFGIYSNLKSSLQSNIKQENKYKPKSQQ